MTLPLPLRVSEPRTDRAGTLPWAQCQGHLAGWAARYASVLPDDPGSAVLTLTSYGMVQGCRPHGRDASPLVGLWKDPVRGLRETPLESGAQGVLVTVCGDRATRRCCDGLYPVDDVTEYCAVNVHQIRVDPAKLP